MLVLGCVLVSSTVVVAPTAGAAPDPAAQIGDALAALDRADGAARAAETKLVEGEERLAADRRTETLADDAVRAAAEVATREGEVTRQLAVVSYMAEGAANEEDRRTVALVLASRAQTMRRVTADLRTRRKELASASRIRSATERKVDATRAARDSAVATRSEREHEADVVLSGAGAGDLPAISYLAYRAVAQDVNDAAPQCRLPAAVLAAIGRVRWMHGWQASRMTELVEADADASAPRDPYDIERAITPIAARLCAVGGSLDRAVPLAIAVRTAEPDPVRADVVLAVAHRYSHTAGLDLGIVPDEATALDTTPLLDEGGPLATGDVAAMLAWGRSRIGVPYSQCLGADVRPQDPPCPPGTNRFGRGFFDCSGFVSAAFRRIGIVVPTTTAAMEADERFMATRVTTTFDPAIVQPGDVFLMDGHTGIYAGAGLILHATGNGLTLERIPAWVAHATTAILRPEAMR